MDPQWQQKIEQDIKEAQETALPLCLQRCRWTPSGSRKSSRTSRRPRRPPCPCASRGVDGPPVAAENRAGHQGGPGDRPALVPPEVTMDPQWQQKIEQDIKEAQETALPLCLQR